MKQCGNGNKEDFKGSNINQEHTSFYCEKKIQTPNIWRLKYQKTMKMLVTIFYTLSRHLQKTCCVRPKTRNPKTFSLQSHNANNETIFSSIRLIVSATVCTLQSRKKTTADSLCCLKANFSNFQMVNHHLHLQCQWGRQRLRDTPNPAEDSVAPVACFSHRFQ